MSVIKLDKIDKSYGKGDNRTPVLSGIDIDIEKGDFVAIVGASGSGKTTLMNIIGLLDAPDQGEYYLDGQDAGQFSEKQRARKRREEIGFVFQSFNLIPRVSARQNVELPMIYDKVSRKDRRFQSERLLKLVGLEDRMKYRPSQLSGGQKQRVAIARALANKPKIILADEPTGNLDSKTGDLILKILKKLNDRGNTVIIITHDANVAKYTKRTIRLTDGQITSNRRGQ